MRNICAQFATIDQPKAASKTEQNRSEQNTNQAAESQPNGLAFINPCSLTFKPCLVVNHFLSLMFVVDFGFERAYPYHCWMLLLRSFILCYLLFWKNKLFMSDSRITIFLPISKQYSQSMYDTYTYFDFSTCYSIYTRIFYRICVGMYSVKRIRYPTIQWYVHKLY